MPPRPPSIAHRLDDPRRAALMVIDMQNAFVDPDEPLCVPGAMRLAGIIAPIVVAMRKAGGTIVWMRHTVSDAVELARPAWATAHLEGARLTAAGQLRPGHHGHEIYSALAVNATDLIVDKYRFSAFLPDVHNLHSRLRARGIDTVVIVGILTNYCCQATARDALMLDYKVAMPPDATAARSDIARATTLNDMASMGLFDLRMSDELLADLRGDRPTPDPDTGGRVRPVVPSSSGSDR